MIARRKRSKRNERAGEGMWRIRIYFRLFMRVYLEIRGGGGRPSLESSNTFRRIIRDNISCLFLASFVSPFVLSHFLSLSNVKATGAGGGGGFDVRRTGG